MTVGEAFIICEVIPWMIVLIIAWIYFDKKGE